MITEVIIVDLNRKTMEFEVYDHKVSESAK
jgi:hypothetical protein